MVDRVRTPLSVGIFSWQPQHGGEATGTPLQNVMRATTTWWTDGRTDSTEGGVVLATTTGWTDGRTSLLEIFGGQPQK